MSTRKGATTRARPQRHQNRTAFKNDLHDKTPKMKMINNLHVCEVCERCKAQIEWKIKYKKYKPLTQPKTCARCQQKTVKKAYHVICRECSQKDRVCAKCLKSADEVTIEPPRPSEEEQLQLQVEMDRLIKSLSERKRRTFLRYMRKGKEAEPSEEGESKVENGDEPDKKEKPDRVPHTREDLLKKIEELKLDEDDEDGDFSDDDFSSDFDASDLDEFYD
ncbi:unnamed protein product [Hermetia illucens]|uniref:Uncharacterized protein n=1 Tax=Hermetia illucens TaxID=343691 RepID=A0A7R8V4M3_HERIL|nr:uncharacterized protein C9orf85 homolog [Hermetia illucens]CAD7091540.1 unnamed protein product [Hermetia illucens]